MKRTISESQLKQIVAESVKKVLKEGYYDEPDTIDYYRSQKSAPDDAIDKVGALLLQALRILEPLSNFDDGAKYMSARNSIASCWFKIKNKCYNK